MDPAGTVLNEAQLRQKAGCPSSEAVGHALDYLRGWSLMAEENHPKGDPV